MVACGSRENILKAKLEILEGLKQNGTIIINYDNDLLNNWYQNNQSNYNIITYGITKGSNILGENIKIKENGSECEINIENEKYLVHIPIGGEHFVSNTLCAIAVAKSFNIPINQALEGIQQFELTKSRMEIKKSKIGSLVINDCYNANYDSTKAALDYLSSLPNKRKIAVLGDMLELGNYSKNLHEQVGQIVANNKIHILICVGEESKHIAKKAQEQGMNKQNIFICANKNEAINILNEKLQKDDAVLIKASNSLKFIDICNAICE